MGKLIDYQTLPGDKRVESGLTEPTRSQTHTCDDTYRGFNRAVNEKKTGPKPGAKSRQPRHSL